MAQKKGKKAGDGLRELNVKLDRVIAKMSTKEDVEEINKKADRIIDAMVTGEDIKLLEERLERKIDERIGGLIESIDRLATPIADLRLEYAAIAAKLTRYEDWFKILAKKTGVKLPL